MVAKNLQLLSRPQDGWSQKVFDHHATGLGGFQKPFCDYQNTEIDSVTDADQECFLLTKSDDSAIYQYMP